MNITIRRASENEHANLTEIAFAAKHYWDYPKSYYEIWKNELTITPDYINKNEVFVAQYCNDIVGFISIVEVKNDFCAGKVFVRQGFWLEHIFILPKYMQKGIGRKLMEFAKKFCKQNKIFNLYIFSDPYAKGFYDCMGAKYLGESLSSIEGRTVSLYEYDIGF